MKKNILIITIVLLLSTSLSAKKAQISQDLNFIEMIKNSVMRSLQSIKSDSLTPETLQKLSNVFLTAFQYAQLDLECNVLKQKLFKKILKLKTMHENAHELTAITNVVNKLQSAEEKTVKAATVWNHVAQYLNQSEQSEIASIMNTLAMQRLTMFNELLKSFNKEFQELVTTTYDANAQSLINSNAYNNSLLAIAKKEFLIDYNQQQFVELNELESCRECVSKINTESLKILLTSRSVSNYYYDFLVLSAVIDMLYYNSIQELIAQKFPETSLNVLMFNEHGLIPEHERIELLPHVIN